jgi:UDP-N-acetylmuramyl tripeptide synthase
MGCVSAAFYGNPTENMILFGVTGTNGKTTTTYMIKSILEQAGKKTGLIGHHYQYDWKPDDSDGKDHPGISRICKDFFA